MSGVLSSGSGLGRATALVVVCFAGTAASVSATGLAADTHDPAVEARAAELRERYRRPAARPTRVARATATSLTTVASPVSAFDRWTHGEANAISDDAKRGLVLFAGKANCATCHSGAGFTDDRLHAIDPAITHTRRDTPAGRGATPSVIRTPSLRGVANRGRYLRGTETDLAGVIAFHSTGGRARRPSVTGDARPLTLTRTEQRQLLALLYTLDEARAAAPAGDASGVP